MILHTLRAALLLAGTGVLPPGAAHRPLPPLVPRSSAEPVSDTLTLQQAIALALETDPELAVATAGFDQAAAGVRIAEATRLPSVTGLAQAVRFEEPMVVAPIHAFDVMDAPTFDRTLVQGRLEVGYTLWDGGNRGARIDGARALRSAEAELVRAERQDALVRVVDAYLAVLTARDVVGAQSARQAELQAELQRVQRLVDEGAAPPLERLRAEAELSSATAEAVAASARLERAEFRLATLLGRPPGEIGDAALLDVGTGSAGDGGRQESLDDHPAILAARSRLDAARAAARQSDAAWLPRLRANGALVEYGGGSSDYATEWQAGIQLEYPLFTGGARSGEADRARARARAAEAELVAVRRRLDEALDAARSAEREARARTEALSDAVLRFEELARVEALALDEGVGVQRDFLRAQAGLLQARAGLAEARRAVILARVRVARAMGRLTPEWIDRTLEPAS